jgi:hypothetical protein
MTLFISIDKDNYAGIKIYPRYKFDLENLFHLTKINFDTWRDSIEVSNILNLYNKIYKITPTILCCIPKKVTYHIKGVNLLQHAIYYCTGLSIDLRVGIYAKNAKLVFPYNNIFDILYNNCYIIYNNTLIKSRKGLQKTTSENYNRLFPKAIKKAIKTNKLILNSKLNECITPQWKNDSYIRNYISKECVFDDNVDKIIKNVAFYLHKPPPLYDIQCKEESNRNSIIAKYMRNINHRLCFYDL